MDHINFLVNHPSIMSFNWESLKFMVVNLKDYNHFQRIQG